MKSHSEAHKAVQHLYIPHMNPVAWIPKAA